MRRTLVLFVRYSTLASPSISLSKRDGAVLHYYSKLYIYHIKFSFLFSIFEVFRYCQKLRKARAVFCSSPLVPIAIGRLGEVFSDLILLSFSFREGRYFKSLLKFITNTSVFCFLFSIFGNSDWVSGFPKSRECARLLSLRRGQVRPYCPVRRGPSDLVSYSSISYSFSFRYNVLSLIPKSNAASFRLPLCFFNAFMINSFSLSIIFRLSSTSSWS